MRAAKIIVITGATRGIGRNLARYFAERGQAVVGTGRDLEAVCQLDAELRQSPTPGLALQLDILHPEQIEQAINLATNRFGRIDTWINNAGVFTAIGPTWEVHPGAWTADLTTNLVGTFNCVRSVTPAMIRQNSGRIINVVGGGTGAEFKFASAYGVSKTAIARLTENVAAELDGTNVLCFAMDPGLNKTDMTMHQLRSPDGQKYLPRIASLFAQGKDAAPERAPELAMAISDGHLDAFNGRIVGIYETVDAWKALAAQGLGRDRFKLRISKS